MNICIFTNTLLSGGAEKQAVLLAKVLNEKYNIFLVIYYGEKVEHKYLEIVKNNHIKTIYLYGNHLKRIFNLYKFLRREKIDIIFSYLLTTNFLGGLIGKIAGVEYTIGGIRNSQISKKKLIIQRFLHNSINYKTIYNNFCGVEQLSKLGFKREKSIVIPNCYELTEDPVHRPSKKNVVVLSVGRFYKSKDYYTAIKSIAILKKSFQDLEYYIIGYGILENKVNEWIRYFNASDYIKVIINPDNLEHYYKMANIYLQTSLYEGLSNAIMEAMSFSLPLVVTRVGDNDKLVINGENGYLCTPKDSEKFAVCLLELCNSPELREKFGQKSYQILKYNYSLDKFKQQYIDFIESLKK
jgi:glycosyltransferase involved in cell wall biosynthesis